MRQKPFAVQSSREQPFDTQAIEIVSSWHLLRIYGELRLLEDEIARAGGKTDRNALTARLDNLEKEANHLRMPLAYASMLYTVRDHIGLVREALNKERSRPPTSQAELL